MFKNIDLNFNGYSHNSPKLNRVDWWNLPDYIKLKLDKFPTDIKRRGNFITVKRLRQSKNRKSIAKNIISIKTQMTGTKSFKINFPIALNNKAYTMLYALMTSEGSYRTEFSLNVPEREFHILFKECIRNLLSEEATNLIKSDYNKDFLRSRAPAICRYLIPMPSQIPSLVLKDKNLAREYLKVAFEAEGSPILNKKQHKRYIKISRYVDITPFVSNEKIPLKKRIFISELKEKYSKLFEKIKNHPPKLLSGEQILLKHYFDVDSKLALEAIRKNKTNLRCGKITTRWTLIIYADNINRFIKMIGFISKRKNKICEEMMLIPSRRQQFFTLKIINSIQRNNLFLRKDFCREMTKLGYKSPQAYLWRYEKKGLIKRIKVGHYKLIY